MLEYFYCILFNRKVYLTDRNKVFCICWNIFTAYYSTGKFIELIEIRFFVYVGIFLLHIIQQENLFN